MHTRAHKCNPTIQQERQSRAKPAFRPIIFTCLILQGLQLPAQVLEKVVFETRGTISRYDGATSEMGYVDYMEK